MDETERLILEKKERKYINFEFEEIFSVTKFEVIKFICLEFQ